jgi:hypothetical protein
MRLEQRISRADAELKALAEHPDLSLTGRRAVWGMLSTLRGVALVHRVGRLAPIPAADCRQRQLPVGDRDDGGCDDAA